MRVAFAFLLNAPIHNAMRKLSLIAHQRYKTGFAGAQLPPHVSLKQPFAIDDLSSLESFFDQFAATITPFALTLTRLDVQMQQDGNDEQVVLWVDVAETPQLRSLHQRLNIELARQFANTAAPFDGPAYRFHATVAIATLPAGTHREMLADFGAQNVDLTCAAKDLALFYYDDEIGATGSYITYKVVSVGPQVLSAGVSENPAIERAPNV